MAWNFDKPSFPNFDFNIQHPVVDGTVAGWDNSVGIPNVRNFHQRQGPFQSDHPGLPNADQAAGRGGGLTGPNKYDGTQFSGMGILEEWARLA